MDRDARWGPLGAPRPADRWSSALALALIVALPTLTGAAESAAPVPEQEPAHRNLQVLPEEISKDELLEVMLENLHGLGLPRRAGEGCLYCHAGSLDVPRGQWDWASDANPMKAKARTMMAMTREINQRFLAALGQRIDPGLRVTCHTCHAGRTDPSPLDAVLGRRYREGGVDSLEAAYREARATLYAADAYDFRVGTLVTVAQSIADLGHPEDATRVHELNIEFDDTPEAQTALLHHLLLQAYQAGGVEATLAAYRDLRATRTAAGFTPSLLESLGWRVFRGGDQRGGLRLFELNFEEHPETFPAHESLAYALASTGDPERGLALARKWLSEHPHHASGRQLLRELGGEPAEPHSTEPR